MALPAILQQIMGGAQNQPPAGAPPQPDPMPPPAPAPGMMPPQPAPINPDAQADTPQTPEIEDIPDFDLTLTLTEAERRELETRLSTKIAQAFSQLSDRHDRIRQWREQYEAVTFPKNFPWPNAASLNVPLTRSIVDTIAANVYTAITDVLQLFRVEAYPAPDTDVEELSQLASKIEHLVTWQMQNHVDIGRTLDMAILPSLRDGVVALKLTWNKSVKRMRRPSKEIHPETGNATWALIEEDVYEYNQPQATVIDALDFFLYPANTKSIKDAIGVGHRLWKNKNALMQGVKDGMYDEAQVKRLLETPPAPDTDNETKGGDSGTQSNVGLDNGNSTDQADQPYELFDCIWQYDADGDGLDEDCWFTVAAGSGIIIRAEKYPFWHGERCFFDMTPLPRPNSFYGYSLCEILEDLQAEINAIRNQRVDAGTMLLAPIYVMSRGARFDPSKVRLSPGTIIKLDDPERDIRLLSTQSVQQSSFSEQQFAQEEAERVTGVSDTSIGASPSRSRPLGETEAIQAGGKIKFGLIVSRVLRVLTSMVEQMLLLDRQYLTAPQEFAITQSSERLLQEIKPEDLSTRVKVTASSNALQSADARRQAAETLYQAAQTNPLMQTPTHLWNVSANMLEAMGIQNVASFIGTEEEAEQKEQAAKNAPQQPPPAALSGKLDDPASLALMLKEGQISPQDYDQAAQMILNHTAGKEAIAQTGQMIQDAHQGGVDHHLAAQDSIHKEALAQHGAEMQKDVAEHGAITGLVGGIMGAKAQQNMTPVFPLNGGNAAPQEQAPEASNGA